MRKYSSTMLGLIGTIKRDNYNGNTAGCLQALKDMKKINEEKIAALSPSSDYANLEYLISNLACLEDHELTLDNVNAVQTMLNNQINKLEETKGE
jgi:hypothetical protein